MASLHSSMLLPPNLLSTRIILNVKPCTTHLRPLLASRRRFVRLFAVAEQATVTKAARRLYVGNIPRNVTNDELSKIVQEHGAVEKAEVFQFSRFSPFY